jgi:hypothetical protein
MLILLKAENESYCGFVLVNEMYVVVHFEKEVL